MVAENVEAPDKRSIRADAFILGLTGSLGSGCTFIAKGIAAEMGGAARYYSLSQFLYQKAAEQGDKDPATETLQDLGNELRREHGDAILAVRCNETIMEEAEKGEFTYNDDTVFLIDGIRNDGEIRAFRQYPNFYLISVHADEDVRLKRLVGPQAQRERFSTDEDFKRADVRDQHEDDPHGQQVKRCNYLSDIVIENNLPIPQTAPQERSEFFNNIVNGYIEPIKAARKGRTIHERPPTVDECLMTIAYATSKRSRCLKRKVGAVIANVAEPTKGTEPDTRRNTDRRFQVLGTGFNDVPPGSRFCVFESYECCYRDYLKEMHAQEFIYCPKCGEQIPEKERKNPYGYVCSRCKCKVFETFLPGEMAAPGKLMDMCRSLHAEENAILGLSEIARPKEGKLALYCTTFPCNLCANKIVAAGIKEVVYTEPYPMEEAKSVLENGGVNVKRFTGVKSRAYFRLYT